MNSSSGVVAGLDGCVGREPDTAKVADRDRLVTPEKVHDLHVWTVTSGYPTLSAHVVVARGPDCHRARTRLADLLHERFEIGDTTLQVDHGVPGLEPHGADPHGPRHSDPLKSPYGDP